MNIVIKCILIIILIYCTFTFIKTYSEIEYVVSDIDNKIYTIRRGYNKSKDFLKKSANTLANINISVEKLITHLENTKNKNTDYFVKKLRENYNSYMISEAAVDPKYTTYTVDKQDMHICLRTRDQYENIYDMNLLIFVVLHELAHLCNYDKYGNPIIGHGFEFKHIFKFLVEEAIKIGIYTYTDYSKTNKEYCGIKITTNIF